MPTYEYKCQSCGHQFEKFQSIADRALTICPQELCRQKPWGRGRVKRVIGAGAGLIFKGSGFYSTDYRSESYREGAKKESPSSAPAAGGDGKSAAKPEAKSQNKSESKTTRSKEDAK